MLHWLVVLTCFNHLEKSWSSSMGRMTSHNMKWKVKVMFQTTKQSRFLNAYGMAWAIQFASPHPQQWPWRPWTNPPATSKVPTVSMLAAMMGVPLHTCDSGPSQIWSKNWNSHSKTMENTANGSLKKKKTVFWLPVSICERSTQSRQPWAMGSPALSFFYAHTLTWVIYVRMFARFMSCKRRVCSEWLSRRLISPRGFR